MGSIQTSRQKQILTAIGKAECVLTIRLYERYRLRRRDGQVSQLWYSCRAGTSRRSSRRQNGGSSTSSCTSTFLGSEGPSTDYSRIIILTDKWPLQHPVCHPSPMALRANRTGIMRQDSKGQGEVGHICWHPRT